MEFSRWYLALGRSASTCVRALNDEVQCAPLVSDKSREHPSSAPEPSGVQHAIQYAALRLVRFSG